MMTSIFLHVFNLSMMAGWMVLAVLLLRLCLRKAPRWITCVLWGLVALRLVVPFTIESPVSLIPTAQMVVSNEDAGSIVPVVDSGMTAVDKPLNDWLQTPVKPQGTPPVQSPLPPVSDTTPDVPQGGTNVTPQPPVVDTPTAPEEKAVSRMERLLMIAAPVWLVGIGLMLLYELISFLRVRSRVLDAVHLCDNVWQSDRVESPFIFGLFRPRIYVPYGLDRPVLESVLAHERAHLHRCDHWVKVFAFTLLAMYWYNPLLWVAYILLCRDIEVACDERVIRSLDKDTRRQYATALLQCGVERRSIAACPLAFGEVSIKHRIKSVLNYRRPMLRVIVASLAVCAVAAVCLLTVPMSRAESIGESSVTTEADVDAATTTTTSPTNGTTTGAPPNGSTAGSTVNGVTSTQMAAGQTTSTLLQDGNHTHSYGSWQIAVAPACETSGYRQRGCACGATETENIAAVGHTYIQKVCVTCGEAEETGLESYYNGQPNVVGNENGASTVAAQSGWLYFAADNCRIIKMTIDGYAVSTLWMGEASVVKNINVCGDWIYFYWMDETNLQKSCIAKVRTDGSGFAVLRQGENVYEMLVVNDKLYFTAVGENFSDWALECCPLYVMSVNGGEVRMLHEGYVDSLSSDGASLYFRYIHSSGAQSVRRLRLSTNAVSTVMEKANVNQLSLEGDRLYFVAPIAGQAIDRIQSISVDGGAVTEHGLASGNGEWLHVMGNYIYYYGRQASGSSGIIELNKNTGSERMIYVADDDVPCERGQGILMMTQWSEDGSYYVVNLFNPYTNRWTQVSYI